MRSSMKQSRIHKFLTSLLLVAFLVDATNAFSLYTPHFVAFHEVGDHLETHDNSIHDECLKHPPIKHLLKFTDIDSPLLQADSDSIGFSETIEYAMISDGEITLSPPMLVSLHKLCTLII